MADDTIPGPRRAELMRRLEAAVERQLGWLREHGYEVAEARWPVVRLDSERVALWLGYSVGHGGRLVIGVSLQERGEPERRSLGSIQHISGLPELPTADAVVESDDDVDAVVARISEQLRTIEPLVAGQEEAFRTLRRRYKESLAATTLAFALEDASREAAEAWRERDLERVVAILEPLEGHLPRHQQGWLDYARRNRSLGL